MIKRVLEQGIRENRFRKMDVEPMAEFLFSIYIMFIIRAYVKSEGKPVEAIFEAAVDLMINGLLCRQGVVQTDGERSASVLRGPLLQKGADPLPGLSGVDDLLHQLRLTDEGVAEPLHRGPERDLLRDADARRALCRDLGDEGLRCLLEGIVRDHLVRQIQPVSSGPGSGRRS